MKRLTFIALILIIPVFVYAHIYIIETAPSEGELLKKAPEKVRITFVGSVEPVFSKIEVFDRNGKKISGKTRYLEDNTVIEVDLKGDIPPGIYTVKWKCMSLDGHKQAGEYTFRIE